MKRKLLMLCAALAALLPAKAFYMETSYGMENGKMIVTAAVNGVRGKFIVDTGAPCCLSANFAKKCGIPAESGIPQRSQDSNGNIVMSHVVQVRSFALGGVDFQQLQAMRMAPNSVIDQFGIDGIVGYNLLKQGKAKFDGRNRRFIMSDDDEKLGIDYNCGVVMVPDHFLALIPVRMGVQTDTVMFDTGAESLYEMCTKTYDRVRSATADINLLATGKGTLSMGAAGMEDASVKYRLKMPEFNIGNSAFANVTTITTDAHDSRIGNELLKFGDVIIDYAEGIFYFQPYEQEKVPDCYQPDWNVVPVVMGNKVVAGMVWEAPQNGLNTMPQPDIVAGDQIVAIGDTRCETVDMRMATTTNLFNMNPYGTKITYRSSKTGKEETMTIKMQ